jgi:hypothetical protein
VVHGHTRILGIEYQGVADGLNVLTVHPNLPETVYHPIYRIRIDMIRVDLHGVGMRIQSISLGIILGKGALRSKPIPSLLIIQELLAV